MTLNRGSASWALAMPAIHSSLSVMLMKPGPLTSALASMRDPARYPARRLATSRGGWPTRLPSDRAALDWKSANADGRITGSASAYSGPNSAMSAALTCAASAACGSAISKAYRWSASQLPGRPARRPMWGEPPANAGVIGPAVAHGWGSPGTANPSGGTRVGLCGTRVGLYRRNVPTMGLGAGGLAGRLVRV